MATKDEQITPSNAAVLLNRLGERGAFAGQQLAALTQLLTPNVAYGGQTPTTAPAAPVPVVANLAAPVAPVAQVPVTSAGTVQTTPLSQLQATAAAQKQYAEGIQAGTLPATTPFPRLTDFSAAGEPVSGGALTPQVLLGRQFGVAPEAVTTRQFGADTVYGFRDPSGVQNFTNVIPGTPGAQPLLSRGGVVFSGGSTPGTGLPTTGGSAGINFGATGAPQVTAQQTPDALTSSVNQLIGQALGMANTQPSGSDTFVNFFQKAATRKRGQEALANLAQVAGQAAARRAEQADVNALQAQRYNQEVATDLLKTQLGQQAALAKLQVEAPKAQAETKKAQLETENLQLAQNARLAYLQNPTPENAAILQSIITGQAQAPQKPTVVKTLTEKGESVGLLSPQGRVLAQGTLPEIQEQQQASAALAASPDQPYRSTLNPSLIYYIDPTTKRMTSGSPQQYAAAIGSK